METINVSETQPKAPIKKSFQVNEVENGFTVCDSSGDGWKTYAFLTMKEAVDFITKGLTQ